SVKNTLKRLQIDYVDVLQCHRFDPDTPIPEVMQTLHDVVQDGYVRYSMLSIIASMLIPPLGYAINKSTPFISMQNHHNFIYREGREIFPILKIIHSTHFSDCPCFFGVGAISWSPLARGVLTRPLDVQTTRGSTNRLDGALRKKDKIVSIVLMQLYSTKKRNSGVTASIVGTTSLRNLEDIIASIPLVLDAEEMLLLEEPYKHIEVIGHT
ncbi:NADP-dependent oxidoreductase domain-containing protein, partial [Lentinula aciculospora]